MRHAQRPPVHVPDEVCLLGGIAVMAAAVPLVIWSVELIFALMR